MPRLQNLFDVGEEALGVRAVNDAVVEGEGEVGHLADGYHVIALFGGDDTRALLDCADAEDGDLRLVDDGRAEESAEDAGVRDGEGSARDLVGLELLGARALGQVVGGARESGDGEFVGALDDGDDQAPVERDGHAEVDVALVDDLVAADLRVEDGKLSDGLRDGLEDEGHVGELRPRALPELPFVLLAQAVDARHVYLIDGGDVRRGALRHDHVLGDALAHDRHRLDAVALAGLDGRRLRGAAHGRRFRRGRRDGRRGLRRRTRLDVAEDVVLRHAARRARAFEARDIYAVLGSDLSDERA